MHIVVAIVLGVQRSLLLSSRKVRVCPIDFRIALRMQTIEQRFQFRVIQK